MPRCDREKRPPPTMAAVGCGVRAGLLDARTDNWIVRSRIV
jgi:hypothetical protein